ncbi:DUF4293 domain-containing protein [Flavobacterium sp. RHBU_3]|uniref:DUF4293 domain-containing protein n=1 Tax=Flavobacterium sp. RHBU_3 TaxID=3391184 RepID=UPI0039853C8B
MIQRIQSIYLIIAILASGILPLFLPLYTLSTDEDPTYFNKNIAYVFLFVASATLSVVSLFSYKKRKNQFVIGRLNIILNFILLGLFIYRLLNLSGDAEVSEKGIGIYLPLVSIVFLSLANRAIKKDEDLVKSADRLR